MCRRDRDQDDDKHDRHHRHHRYPWDDEDNRDKVTQSLDKIVSGVGTLANTVFDVSLDAGKEFNERARDWSNRIFHDVDNTIEDTRRIDPFEKSSNEFKFPSFYETRDAIQNTVASHPFLNDLWSQFPGMSGFSKGKTPFGYYAYKGPGIRTYNDCLEKNGKSIWDDKGYWRCLFPNSEVPVEMLNYKKEHLSNDILTKEDFMNAMKDASVQQGQPIDLKEKGTFFNTFEDFLNWKNNKYKEAQAKKLEQQKKWQEERKQQLISQNIDPATRFVVSSSVKSNMYTDSETNETRLVEVREECFDDGTCTTTKITKLKPFGSSEWAKVEEESSNDKSKGWFWK